jgi:hypothetical protein
MDGTRAGADEAVGRVPGDPPYAEDDGVQWVDSGKQEGMPRFIPKGMLERNALADLWKHSLSRIPRIYGRLAYLASLRDPNSGAYRHHGLSAAFGREESARALQESHEQVFVEWLKLPLAGKSSDLREYLEGLDDGLAVVTTTWLRTGHHRTLVPDRATRAQQAHFRNDMEVLLDLIRSGAAAGQQAPGSRQSL